MDSTTESLSGYNVALFLLTLMMLGALVYVAGFYMRWKKARGK